MRSEAPCPHTHRTPHDTYFEHSGALMTADGSDDHLIKLEGAPAGYKLTIPK